MRELGVIRMDDLPEGLTLARWMGCVSRKPQYVPESRRYPDRWSIMAGGACVGSLGWNYDPRSPGKPGNLVVAAVRQHACFVARMAASLADELGARFQPCSARFVEIEQLVQDVGTQPVEIVFDDGRTLLALADYCALKRDEEHLYYYNLDPACPSHGAGLCRTRIGSIRLIRPSDLRRPDGDSQG